MATIHVDGQEYQVDGADNLLQACLGLGLDIPYFCWHPALGSVGACRQCAVKQFANAEDKQGRLVMSCMTPVTDDSWIAIEDTEAKEFRKSVIEWLMTNHPHDCPVCEEGGNCHLQDMTVMSGHRERRYRFDKRTHHNQNLGPFIGHEMNRCIACYRCVRYYQDYADGNDLGVFGAHNDVYFGRIADGPLENEFSGNLVDICPTGVFTDKTHSARYNRKWDMQFAPSICQQCAVGCNISPGERYGELRRIENRYNGSINHYFLCDRGRFGYGYVNNPSRVRQSQLLDITTINNTASNTGTPDISASPNNPTNPDGPTATWQTVDANTAIKQVEQQIGAAKHIIGIGSPRASIETNFQLRELVGKDNFYSGLNADELSNIKLILDILQTSSLRTPSLREMEQADAVLILGEDVTQTAPRIALAVRQASKKIAPKLAAERKIPSWHAAAVKDVAQHARYPVFIANFTTSRLDDIAATTYQGNSEDLARFGFAIAHSLDPQAPEVADLDPKCLEKIQQIADSLKAATKPLIISGTGACSPAIIQAATNIAKALKNNEQNCEIAFVVPEVNSLGAAMLGGAAVDDALISLKDGHADAVIILENDLYRRCDSSFVDKALAAAKSVIVADHQLTATAAKATVLLSSASFAEAEGTVINSEGRAQRYFPAYDPLYIDPNSGIRPSWYWLQTLVGKLQPQTPTWEHVDAITQACAQAIPALARIVDAAPDANFRTHGLKIAREPRRYSGRTAMRANISVHEPRAPQDDNSALAFSMEGYSGPLEPGALTAFAWSPGWNSSAAWNKFQDEIGGPLRGGDPGVRILEPAAITDQNQNTAAYIGQPPEAFVAQAGTWRALPLYHIFGSEELSTLAAPIQARTPTAYAAFAVADAQQLGVVAGATVKIKMQQRTWELPVCIMATLTTGTIGLPRLPNMPVITSTTWVEVSL